jgi:tetratricopeptide (TPR) repeat protein
MDKRIKQHTKTENSTKPSSKAASPIIWVSFWKSRENLLLLTAILIVSFIVYLPSLQNGFVNWDDGANIYENPNIINISDWESFFENTKGIFTTQIIGGYTPLVILSFAFEKMLYGLDNPEWWHLTNIILHLTCVLLVFRIALALGLKLIPAAFCAILFGIHPMRVESVAWITERKDVLYGSFYLIALYYYIKSVKLSFERRYVAIIFLSFILALLSKIQAVVLPLSMLLVDYYFCRKLTVKLVYEKWLYFILSLMTGLVGIYFLKAEGTIEQGEKNPLLTYRIFIGSYSYIIYIIKSVVPYKMVPFNPFPHTISWVFYSSMALALTIPLTIYYFFLNKKKVLVFGLLFFTCNIMFLLQIKIGGQAFLADRFTYIAYLGLFFIYAFGLQWLLRKYQKFNKLIYLTVFLILGVLGYVNFEQNKIWKNGETLWSHVLKYYPGHYLAWENRANYYSNKGRIKEAIDGYSKGISLHTNSPFPYYRRGNLFFDLNHPDTLRLAVQDYSRAILLSPENTTYLLSRGAAYASLYMFDNALQDLNKAERLNAKEYNIYYNRFRIYIKSGQYAKAQSDLEKYLSFEPSNPEMWVNLGEVRRLNKQYEKSLDAFNRAIQIDPANLGYYYNRLTTFYEMGDIQRARNDLNFLKSKGFKGINPEYERIIN